MQIPVPRRLLPFALALPLLLGACGGTASPGSGPDSGSPDSGSPDAGSPDSGSPDAGGPDGGSDGGCLGSDLLTSLGKSSVLIGASMADATAAAASWDVRYLYLAGGLFDGATPCSSCTASCSSGGTSCAAGQCGWWGCWQETTPPPGLYAQRHISSSKGNGQIAMFTYYEMLAAAGWAEGGAEVDAVNDPAKLTRYFNDYRFLLQQIGAERAILHLEPDLWAYAQQKNGDPDQIPAKVKAANPTDCGALADTWSGFGRCLIAMTRKYAPNAKVGLHGSAWATGIDVGLNTNASLDVAGEARKLAAFLAKCGGSDADFVAVDASDRDGDWYRLVKGQPNHWWDASNQTLPHFHQAFAWAKALAEGVGRPVVYWQVPVGNAAQGNTKNHYKDNRVDYFFDHPAELAAAHIAGMFFGAGDGDQTTPESDGSNLVSKAKAWRAAGATPLCK